MLPVETLSDGASKQMGIFGQETPRANQLKVGASVCPKEPRQAPPLRCHSRGRRNQVVDIGAIT